MLKNKPNNNHKPGRTIEKRGGSSSLNESTQQHKTSALISGDKVINPVFKPNSGNQNNNSQ